MPEPSIVPVSATQPATSREDERPPDYDINRELNSKLDNPESRDVDQKFAIDFWISPKSKHTCNMRIKDSEWKAAGYAERNHTERTIVGTYAAGGGNPFSLNLGDLLQYNLQSLYDALVNVFPASWLDISIWIKDVVFVWTMATSGSNKGKKRCIFAIDLAVAQYLNPPLPPIEVETFGPPPEEDLNAARAAMVEVIRLQYSSDLFLFYEIAVVNKLFEKDVDGIALPARLPPDGGDDIQPILVVTPPGWSFGALANPFLSNGLNKIKYNSHIDPKLSQDFGVLPIGNRSDYSGQPYAFGDYESVDNHVVWLQLDLTLGPIYFQKIGFKFYSPKQSDGTVLGLLVDGGARLRAKKNALTIYVDQFGVGTDLKFGSDDGPKLNPLIPRGLGFEGTFDTDRLVVSGYLGRTDFTIPAHNSIPEERLTGWLGFLKLVLKLTSAKKLEIDVITEIFPKGANNPFVAVFAYGFAGIELGGGVFTFQGVALGAGINFYLKPPTLDKLPTFPLVKLAMSSPKPWGSENMADVAVDSFIKLQDYLYPASGDYFGAAGIKFQLIKLIDCLALLVIEGGKQGLATIFGMLDAKMPRPVTDQTDVYPLVQVMASFLAEYDWSEGYLTFQAVLNPASYFLDRGAQLTGGLALCHWYSPNVHSGDHVFTIGGYHPKYEKPAHYPSVPLVGFAWCGGPGRTIIIKGGGYFAHVGHGMMLGLSASLNGDFGPAHVWAAFSFDAMVLLDPTRYDVRYKFSFGVSIGDLGLSLGADIHIFGPDFGADATIKIHILFFSIKVHVHIGADDAGGTQAISWADFEKKYLPDGDQVKIGVSGGALQQLQWENQPITIVNPKELELVSSCSIPVNKLKFDGNTHDRSWLSQQVDIHGQTVNPNFGVNPCGVKSSDIESMLDVEIQRLDGENWSPTDRQFTLVPICTPRMPALAWGEPKFADESKDLLTIPKPNDPSFVENTMTGFRLTPAPEPPPEKTQKLETSYLLMEVYPHPNSFDWHVLPKFTPTSDPHPEDRIKNTIRDNTQRSNLLTAFNFDPATEVTVDSSLVDLFDTVPAVTDSPTRTN